MLLAGEVVGERGWVKVEEVGEKVDEEGDCSRGGEVIGGESAIFGAGCWRRAVLGNWREV